MNVRRTAAQREARRRNLRVVHLIVANWLAGALVGAAFASVVIWSDFGGVGRLILRAAPMWPALLLLFGGFAVTFGSIVAGTAIMLIPRDEEPPEDPPDGPLIPVFVAAQGRWRNH